MNTEEATLAPRKDADLVTRTTVPPAKHYSEYKEVLRQDFFHSCAYCTMAESEAQGIRFTIDHYEPQKARPELINYYDNLMYACEECNLRKGDRYPRRMPGQTAIGSSDRTKIIEEYIFANSAIV
jgi:5-methylcytosine-specific restriction endonuclease McrA